MELRMERNTRWPAAALATGLLAAVVACEAEKSENPLSPSVAGPIAGVEITAPRVVQPAPGARIRESQQPIQLMIENATTTGVRPLYYSFEVATDSGFQTKVFARAQVPPGQNGRTSVQLDRLELGRGYFWRVRAEDGANTGPFATLQFEVLPKPVLQPPKAIFPVNNQVVSGLRPTFRVGASDRNAGVGSVEYEFHVAQDAAFAVGLIAGRVGETGGETSFTPGGDLAADRQYYWRARALDGGTASGWMTTQGFRTPGGGSGPGPGPSPSPGGGSAPCGPPYPNNGPDVVKCVESKYPDRLRAGVSGSQRVANMAFLRDRVIETGICGGLDLAWNKKRGTGPHSIDAIAWRTNGRVEVVDIGAAYDDTSRPLKLMWHIVAGPPGYDPYPRPSCK
jgi:hypothetical protein